MKVNSLFIHTHKFLFSFSISIFMIIYSCIRSYAYGANGAFGWKDRITANMLHTYILESSLQLELSSIFFSLALLSRYLLSHIQCLMMALDGEKVQNA